MRYCEKCGKEIMNEAKFCEFCGNPTENKVSAKENFEGTHLENQKTFNLMNKEEQPAVKNIKKNVFSKWFILVGAVVLVIGILGAVLFIPRDLKMDDFKKTNIVSAIFKYGVPDDIDNDEDGVFLRYEDKLDFYGITSSFCLVHTDDNSVTFYFRDDDANDIYDRIERYCKFEDNLLGVYHIFSYGDLEITTNAYDGQYVRIEIY